MQTTKIMLGKACFCFESLLGARDLSFVIWSKGIEAKVHEVISIIEALPFRKIWVAVIQVLEHLLNSEK